MIRSEEHTSELQSLRRISYAVFCLKKKKKKEKSCKSCDLQDSVAEREALELILSQNIIKLQTTDNQV